MSSLHPLSPPSAQTRGAAERELPVREGAWSPSAGPQLISGQHPSAQLLSPSPSGKRCVQPGDRDSGPPHPSPCLSLEKTKPLLYLRKYTETAGGKFQREKNDSPTHNEESLFKKEKGKKKGGPQCHLLLRPSALGGMLMTHPL